MKREYVSVVLALSVASVIILADNGRGSVPSGMSCGKVEVEINGRTGNTEAFYTSRGVEVVLRGGGRVLATQLSDPIKEYLFKVCHAAYENEQQKQNKEGISQ